MSTMGRFFLGLTLEGNPLVVVVDLLFIVALIAALIRLVPATSIRRRRSTLGIIAASVMVAACFVPEVDHDEVEHLHAAWLVSQGDLPFRDFWEHHSPPLWLALAPVLKVWPAGPSILELSRVLALFLSVMAWCGALAIVQRVHPGRGGPRYATLLWLGAVFPVQLYTMRPDLPGNLLVIGALVLFLALPVSAGGLLSGVLMGLAVSFSPKHLLFLGVLPIVLLLERRKTSQALSWGGLYALGLVLGLAPIVFWLNRNGLSGEFVRFVLKFNTAVRGVELGGTMPLFPLALAGMWAYRRLSDKANPLNRAELVLLVALCIGLATFLLQPGNPKFIYHLQMFCILASAAGAIEARRAFVIVDRRWGDGFAIALVGLYFMSTGLPVVDWVHRGVYATSRSEVSKLMEISIGQPVVALSQYHPIFTRDASVFHFRWQLEWVERPELASQASRLRDDIVGKRPAIVFADARGAPTTPRQARVATTTCLASAGAIDLREADRLQEVLESRYRLIRLVNHWYWLRNDVPLPEGAQIVETGPMRAASPKSTRPATADHSSG